MLHQAENQVPLICLVALNNMGSNILSNELSTVLSNTIVSFTDGIFFTNYFMKRSYMIKHSFFRRKNHHNIYQNIPESKYIQKVFSPDQKVMRSAETKKVFGIFLRIHQCIYHMRKIVKYLPP